MKNHDPWPMIRDTLPLVVVLLLGLATILLVSLILPVLIPVAAVILLAGLGYFWWKSGLGRRRPPYDY